MSVVTYSMHKDESWETTDEIVEYAGISKRRFRDWRDRGLAPRPVARPGRGQGRGRLAYYPEGTAELCRAIAEKMEEVYRLGDAAWLLWNEGYPLTGYIRDKLVEIVAAGEAKFTEDLKAWDQSLEEDEPLPEDHPVYQAQFGPPPKGAGRIRQRLGKGPFSTLIYLQMSGLAGEVPPELTGNAPDPELVEPLKQLTERELEGGPESLQRLVSEEKLLDWVPDLFGGFNLPDMRKSLEEMNDSELVALRDETQRIWTRWGEPDSGETPVPPPALFADVLKFHTVDYPLEDILDALSKIDEAETDALLQLFLDGLPLDAED